MERKGDFISNNIRYKKETEVVTFQGKEITLENLSPVFTPEQEATKRRELEQQLYDCLLYTSILSLRSEDYSSGGSIDNSDAELFLDML